jgi:membrane associated rhomboid family serine protease
MEQRGYQDLSGMFPRPGKALKALLITVAAVTGLATLVLNWMPGGEQGESLVSWITCSRLAIEPPIPRIWTLLTAGLMSQPGGRGAWSMLLWSLLGLYFFSPDLERRWGSARFLRFVAASTVTGFGLALVIDRVAPEHVQIFHPMVMYGPGAIITATTVAWSRQNANAHFRLFFLIPMKGSWLFWLAVLYCFGGVFFWDSPHEGVVAPFGGLVTGLLLGGTPSVVRTAYLKAKLALLRSKANKGDRPRAPRPSRSSGEGGPPLRVVYGGLEDELKKRKPPKDKRYLN